MKETFIRLHFALFLFYFHISIKGQAISPWEIGGVNSFQPN